MGEIKKSIDFLKTKITTDYEKTMLNTALSNLKYIAWEQKIRDVVGVPFTDDILIEIARHGVNTINSLCKANNVREAIPENLDIMDILKCVGEHYEIEHIEYHSKRRTEDEEGHKNQSRQR